MREEINILFVSVSVFCMFAISCIAETEEPNEWLARSLPEEVSDGVRPSSTMLSEDRFSSVIATRVHTAVAMLAGKKFVPITKDQVNELVGYALMVKGKKPYLVRGVFAGERGQFQLNLSGNNDLLVLYGPTHSDEGLKLLPVVVFLDKDPNNVFACLEYAD